MDRLIKGTAREGQIRFIAAITKELVQEAATRHKCTPTASAALGRMLTAGILMSSMLKNENEKITLQINGNGAAEGVNVTAFPTGRVKGYIGNPEIDLPANNLGKLDVGGAIGKEGSLYVIRDLGLKEPYTGTVPIQTGEIGDDLAYYFTTSEQTPSAVGVGVLVDRDWTISAAGGFIIQMLPGSDKLLADLISYRLEEMEPITESISEGKSLEEIVGAIFYDMEYNIGEETKPYFGCDCSRDRVERALISLGVDQLKEIYEDNKTEEVKCQFCSVAYDFNHEDLGEIIKNLSKSS